MEIEVLKTKTASIWRREDGIVVHEFLPNSVETLETAKENCDALEKMSDGSKILILSVGSNLKSISREARLYYSSSEQVSRFCKAVATISNTKTGRVIGNFFISFNKIIEVLGYPIHHSHLNKYTGMLGIQLKCLFGVLYCFLPVCFIRSIYRAGIITK